MMPINCSNEVHFFIDWEMNKFLKLGIIEMVDHCECEFISQIFSKAEEVRRCTDIKLESLNEEQTF